MKRLKFIVLVLMMGFGTSTIYAQVSVGISVRIAPPELPVYTQPECPVDGYLWTPGYWAYDDGGYYWVPGVWVAPPEFGYLWTPCYWGYAGGLYVFHRGYWGRSVGYYGGINYGYGYMGTGFVGGQWSGRSFRYNTAVMRVNRTVVHNTYVNRTVIRNVPTNRTSFNGPGGIRTQPRPQDRAAMSAKHIQPTTQQRSHEQVARTNKSQYAKANHGRPAVTAMNKVGGVRVNATGHAAPQRPQAKPAQQHARPAQQRPQAKPAQQHARPAQQHQQMQRPQQQARPAQQRPQAKPAQQHQQQARPQAQQHQQMQRPQQQARPQAQPQQHAQPAPQRQQMQRPQQQTPQQRPQMQQQRPQQQARPQGQPGGRPQGGGGGHERHGG